MLLNYSIVVKKQSFVSKDGFNNDMVSQILFFQKNSSLTFNNDAECFHKTVSFCKLQKNISVTCLAHQYDFFQKQLTVQYHCNDTCVGLFFGYFTVELMQRKHPVTLSFVSVFRTRSPFKQIFQTFPSQKNSGLHLLYYTDLLNFAQKNPSKSVITSSEIAENQSF